MANFFRIIQHLLPKGRPWNLTPSKQLRQFFEGLTVIGDDLKAFIDDVYMDLFPQSTRELAEWETQFNLQNASNLTEQQRRDRLAATWAATGGQSPSYLQNLLQDNGFDVYVHEWWEPPDEQPRTVRNPNLYINASIDPVYITEMGEVLAEMGEVSMEMGETNGLGYLLVNKVTTAERNYLTEMGDTDTEMGEAAMEMGEFTGFIFKLKDYVIPADPSKWGYFVYVGGQTFPDFATLPAERRNEFETLLLKYFPGHLWIGVLVSYV